MILLGPCARVIREHALVFCCVTVCEHALVSSQPRLAAHLFACAYKDTPKALVLADSARLRSTVCVCACSDWCLAGWDVNDGNAAGVGPHATFAIPQCMHAVPCVCV